MPRPPQTTTEKTRKKWKKGHKEIVEISGHHPWILCINVGEINTRARKI